MTATTWKIRDQKPDGSWGPERTVTLAQFKAENERRKAEAEAVFRKAAALLRRQS